MPPAHVQSRAGYGSGGNVVLSFTSNVAAGSLLVASVHLYDGNEGTASVTDSRGNTYTKLYWQIGGDLSLVLALYYTINASAGACTVTVNPGNSGGRFCSIGILEYSGITSSSPLDVYDLNTGTGTAVSGGPITTTNAADLLIAAMTSMAGTNVAITPDADYTQRLEFQNGATEMHLNIQDRIVASTLTDTANWTLASSQGWIGSAVSFKGSTSSGRTATLASTLAPLTAASTADVPVDAALSATLAPLTLASTAELPVTAALAATLADLSLAASAAAPARADLSATLDDLTLAASAGVDPATASLAATLDALALSSTAAAPVTASLAGTLDDLALSSSAELPVVADLSASLDDLTLSATATGTQTTTASLAATLAPLAVTATAAAPVVADLSAALAPATLASTASAPVTAELTATLADAVLSSSAGADVATATLAATLADLSLSSTAVLPVTATATAALAALTLSATAALPVVADLSATLADLSLSAFATEYADATAIVPLTLPRRFTLIPHGIPSP